MQDGLYVTDEAGAFSAPASSSDKSGSLDGEVPKRRVLVVDDERRIADTLCEILSVSGFEALAAYDGWTGLEAATRFHPECLLSDVLMPRMNGVELALAVHRMQPGTKILLFSGQAGITEILEAGQKSGLAFELLAKPIHPAKLLEHLKRI